MHKHVDISKQKLMNSDPSTVFISASTMKPRMWNSSTLRIKETTFLISYSIIPTLLLAAHSTKESK